MPDAIVQINRGIELDPHSSPAYQALTVASSTPGHLEEALAAAQRAVELGPGDAEAWLFHAQALMPIRAPELSLASAQRALEMNPIPPTYFQAIHAKALWVNGRHDDALREARACTRRAPLYNDCRFVQLLVNAQKGDLALAREQLDVLQRSRASASTYCDRLTGVADLVAQCVKWALAGGMSQ